MNPFIHSVISLSPLGHLIITANNFLELKIQFPLKSLFPHLFQEIAELTPVDLSSSPMNRVQVHEPCQSTEGPQRDLLCTAVPSVRMIPLVLCTFGRINYLPALSLPCHWHSNQKYLTYFEGLERGWFEKKSSDLPARSEEHEQEDIS